MAQAVEVVTEEQAASTLRAIVGTLRVARIARQEARTIIRIPMAPITIKTTMVANVRYYRYSHSTFSDHTLSQIIALLMGRGITPRRRLKSNEGSDS